MIKKTFKIKIYDTSVEFIITKDILKTVNNIYKKHNTDYRYTDYIAGIMITMSLNKYQIIINKDFLNINTLSHETFHAVMAITSDRASYEEENRAWLQGYIMQEIFNFLKTKDLTIA